MVGLGPTHPGMRSSAGGCPAPRPIRSSASASRSLDRTSTGSGYLRHLLYTMGYCNSALTARHSLSNEAERWHANAMSNLAVNAA